MTVVMQQDAVGQLAAGIKERFNFTVCGVLFVFIYLFFVDVAYVILPWLSFSVPGVLNLLLLSCSTGCALACYFTCMFTDPGRVPPGWEPDSEQQGSAVQEVKKKDGAPRFCKKCSHYKPPRSHHCRMCDRCVLRMDHHCPWVNNCIGHCNYKPFFGLLIYATLALFHSMGLLIGHALHVVQRSGTTGVIRVGPRATAHSLEGPDTSHFLAHIFMQTFAVAVALPTSVAVFMLLIWHIRMITHNKTTIEHAEGVTAQIKLGAAGKDRLRHPYDLGPCQNWHEVLGEDPFTWLLPSCKNIPGGLSYPTWFDKKADFFAF